MRALGAIDVPEKENWRRYLRHLDLNSGNFSNRQPLENMRGLGKKRERGDHTYHVSSYWRMLRTAEDNAGIAHVKHRAAHGLRRMAAGNVLQLTNNPVVAMQWIGDTDLAMAKRYLKRRDTALQDVANRIVEPLETASAPKSQHETATQPSRGRKTRSARRTRSAPSDVLRSTYGKSL